MFHSVCLTIDIGNSAIKAGLFHGELIQNSIVTHSVEEASARIAAWNAQTSFHQIGLCSVVPKKSEQIISRIRSFTDVSIFEVNINATLPFKIKYTPAESLGPDRLAAACAAWHSGDGSQIIIDAGSAITIDVLSAEGIFLGGIIMPGPTLANRALADYTARLSDVPLVFPEGVLGNSTIEALQHGLLYGMTDGIIGAINRIERTLASTPVITLTGGWHQLLADKIPNVRVNKNLVLDGIRLLMQFNGGLS